MFISEASAWSMLIPRSSSINFCIFTTISSFLWRRQSSLLWIILQVFSTILKAPSESTYITQWLMNERMRLLDIIIIDWRKCSIIFYREKCSPFFTHFREKTPAGRSSASPRTSWWLRVFTAFSRMSHWQLMVRVFTQFSQQCNNVFTWYIWWHFSIFGYLAAASWELRTYTHWFNRFKVHPPGPVSLPLNQWKLCKSSQFNQLWP